MLETIKSFFGFKQPPPTPSATEPQQAGGRKKPAKKTFKKAVKKAIKKAAKKH